MDQGQGAQSRSLFTPKTERIEEDEALTLLVHLRGFAEKHIECRIIAPSHYIRVCSDPALKNWHFDTLFEDIPEKFNLYEATTKFVDGILTIRVPKVIPAQASNGASEAPTRQESSTSKLGAEMSGDATARPQLADKEITETKDVEGREIMGEWMSQKGQDQIPSKANLPLAFTRKLELDDQSTIGQVGDQTEKEKSGESVDQEREGEVKDTENEGSSSGTSVNRNVTRVVIEKRCIVDKCTLLSVIMAIGAYVVYTIYGQSRKKSQ
ncbi:hypothetical protein OIU77_012943 [Salix suchowensis]|uniref:SHSP domain-containing protein n=1 Tax=Salix suchowensis TaxID=1278906 RepID=A0ABQ9A5G1_9ROSI|nr:hypothetical protein OIU77_012943 [Salix suchowensis]